jgi:ubiquinone biosynthesis protein UbiJ
MKPVEVLEPGKASLLTLMLKQLLDRNLNDPGKSRAMQGKVLTVCVRSRRMETTLHFEAGRIRAEDGYHGRPDLEVAGELPALLSVALGASPVQAVLARRLRVRPRSRRGWVHARRLMCVLRLG